MKTEKRGENHLIELSDYELDILTAALMSYEEACGKGIAILDAGGANACNSLAFEACSDFQSKAVDMGKVMYGLRKQSWRDA